MVAGKMRIYEIRALYSGQWTEYCALDLVNDSDRRRWFGRTSELITGNPVDVASWCPLLVKRGDEPGEPYAPLGDLALMELRTAPMALSERALSAVRSRIAHCGQFLPLDFPEAPYSLFNVTRVVDALDTKRSEIKRFEDGGIDRVMRYEFFPELVSTEWVFKVEHSRRGRAFCTERFVDLVNENSLTGFRFDLLWEQ